MSKTSISIIKTIAHKINFASQQNAVPTIRDLTLNNEGESDLEGLTLELTAKPDFLVLCDRFVKNVKRHVDHSHIDAEVENQIHPPRTTLPIRFQRRKQLHIKPIKG